MKIEGFVIQDDFNIVSLFMHFNLELYLTQNVWIESLKIFNLVLRLIE